jgi:hypothetical protein
MLRLVEELGVVTERTVDRGIVTLRFTRRPEAERREAPRALEAGR